MKILVGLDGSNASKAALNMDVKIIMLDTQSLIS
jgi:hypothetical protein